VRGPAAARCLGKDHRGGEAIRARGDVAMRCPVCGADNPEGRKFCGDCGKETSSGNAKDGAVKGGRLSIGAFVILMIALVVMVLAWGWQEDIEGDIEEHRGTMSETWYANELVLLDNAGILWNSGVVLTVLAVVVIALTPVRK